MQRRGSITSMEAFRKYGITRLSGRIYDLRAKGFNIVTSITYGTNRYGKPVKYAAYSLAKEGSGQEEQNGKL